MTLLKKIFRKILCAVSPDWELRIRNQYQFNRYRSQGSKLFWQSLPSGPLERLDAAGAQVGEVLFIFGGLLWGGKVISVVDILDLRRRKWIGRIDMPVGMPQTHLGMVSDDHRYIYSVSGQLGGNCRPPSSACFVFDAHNRTWADFPDLPEARYACTVQIWNGRLHAVGGSHRDRNTPAHDHWSIAVHEGKALESYWRSEPAILRGGPHRSSVVFNNALYVFGGQEGDYIAIPHDPEFRCTGDLTNEIVFPDTYKIEQGNAQWEKMAPMPVSVSHTEFAVVHGRSKIFLVGGQVERNAQTKKVQITDVIQAYDPFLNCWKIIGHLPYRTKATVTAYYDGHLYFTSGQRDNGSSDLLPAREFDRSLWRVKISLD